jgi:hypothetical protein
VAQADPARRPLDLLGDRALSGSRGAAPSDVAVVLQSEPGRVPKRTFSRIARRIRRRIGERRAEARSTRRAALPYVLAQFDALGPRSRVALSLADRRRMGSAPARTSTRPKPRSFSGTVSGKSTRSISARSRAARCEGSSTIRRLSAPAGDELDTVALEGLIDALGTVKTLDDAIQCATSRICSPT